jgi:hypothetical protein
MSMPTEEKIKGNIDLLDRIKAEIIALKILNKNISRPIFSKSDKGSINLSAATKTKLHDEYKIRKENLLNLIKGIL